MRFKRFKRLKRFKRFKKFKELKRFKRFKKLKKQKLSLKGSDRRFQRRMIQKKYDNLNQTTPTNGQSQLESQLDRTNTSSD